MLKENAIENSLNFQLTKVNGTNITLIDKKIHRFSLTKTGKKKRQCIDPLKTLIIRRQQSFELHNQLNPVQITINNDRVLNILKKNKNSYYKLTPIGLLFSSSVQNDTKQILVTCRELNDAKVALINGKILNVLDVKNLNKIENWEYIKGKLLWVIILITLKK